MAYIYLLLLNMKSWVSFVFDFCVITCVNAQTYFNLTDPSSEWRDENQYGIEFSNPYYLNHFSISTDTFFNSHTYAKLNVESQMLNCVAYPLGCNWEPSVIWTDIVYLRDDLAGKIYQGSPLSDSEWLLYDFNLEVGDTLPLTLLNYDIENFVISIDSVLIGSDYRRRYNIGNHISWPTDPFVSLIEGIGGTNGLFGMIEVPFETLVNFICYTNNGETTYFDEPFLIETYIDNNDEACDLIQLASSANLPDNAELQIMGNPVTDVLNVSLNSTITNNFVFEVYDNLGLSYASSITAIPNGNNLSMNLKHLPPGIYYIYIIESNKRYNGCIIKL